MKKICKIFLVLFCFSVMTFAASANQIKMTISVPDPTTSYIYAAAEEFARRASEYSEGTLEFEVVADGVLYNGDTSTGIMHLGGGKLDMVILSTLVYGPFVSGFNVISVPYMFDNQEQLLNFINSEIGEELFNRVNHLGITVVGKWTRSFREITNSKHPIHTPNDLKGIILRVPNNPLFVEFFTQCGAITTPMDFGKVYQALKDEMLDGQENPVDIPASAKFYEAQKYISFTNHMTDAWVVGINSRLFKHLDAEQQSAIIRAGEEVQKWNIAMMAEKDQIALQTLLDNGMEVNEITTDDQQEFINISKTCYPKFRELIRDDELLKKAAKFTGKSVE
ncbi:MAG: DctP family TRAP transporter solute-binding subunit [Synergistaceae bacterium]|nr:DctP family TRAP transporter solute-binding subunit [Synergistaceae bacterium]